MTVTAAERVHSLPDPALRRSQVGAQRTGVKDLSLGSQVTLGETLGLHLCTQEY